MEDQARKELKENLAEFSQNVEAAMKVLDRYETSRPGSMAFTKLEEAMLWVQVLVMNVKPKAKETESSNVDTESSKVLS
jgi:hypothetical protein